MFRKDLAGRVVVIVGASSGIGRATALALAKEGCDLVVAARRDDALNDVVAEIEVLGRRALAVPTDVGVEADVTALAAAALATFGRIDVWINDASVAVIGAFDEVPMADIRQVFETDVFGVMYGSRAVLPVFRRQGCGTLINLSSMVAEVPQPYNGAYVASKAAVKALGGALRQELLLQHERDIHVVTIMPAVIDTPFFVNAANYTGRALQPPPPVNDPAVVAEAIVKAVRTPKREVHIGRPAQTIVLQMRLLPAMTERLMAHIMEWTLFTFGNSRFRRGEGNLYQPPADSGAISGGWGATMPRMWPWSLVVAVAGLGAAIVGWRRRT